MSNLQSLQRTLIRTCPTVTVSEGVTPRISLVEQDDPSVFVFGSPKPVDPPVLLTI
jgi:hypothetical protein